LTSDLRQIVQSTYLGGNDNDGAYSLAISGGNVYVTGHTESSDFPGTTGGAQEAWGGNIDAFVSQLSPDLKQLIQSTFLGGSSDDDAFSIAVSGGKVYVAGNTYSGNFPGTTGGAQPTPGGGSDDAFVALLTGDLKEVSLINIDIDIRPWSKRNPINYKGHGILPVAILSTEDFDAPSQVDQKSLTFGATGNEKSLAFCNRRPKDVSRDGSRDDLICHFYIEIAGFKCGDTEGILKGKTVSGISIEGEDLVRILNCK
jgi:hypothetical protein